MTVKQVAARMEVSTTTVYSLIGSHKLGCYRIGSGRGTIRVSEQHLAEYLRAAEPPRVDSPAPRSRLKHLRLS
jgi:excisionase family DNA binding protein